MSKCPFSYSKSVMHRLGSNCLTATQKVEIKINIHYSNMIICYVTEKENEKT